MAAGIPLLLALTAVLAAVGLLELASIGVGAMLVAATAVAGSLTVLPARWAIVSLAGGTAIFALSWANGGWR